MSQSTPSEHAASRELWLKEWCDGTWSAYSRKPEAVEGSALENCLHVREVRPGEITLTEAEFERIWFASEWADNSMPFSVIARRLFGQSLPEGTQAE